MKNLPSIFLLIFISIFISSSCETSTSDNSENKIVGKWIWLQSSGGWTGGVIRPETVGYSIILVFEEDGHYKAYRNDSLTVFCNYRIERKKYGNELRDILILKERDDSSHYQIDQVIQFENKNKLKLIENCNDCYEHIYVRLSYF